MLQKTLINVLKNRAVVFALMILGALLLFEIFSFSSSYEALSEIWGAGLWAFLIAFSFCAVDFAGLGGLFIPGIETGIGWLFSAWLLSAFGDTGLTYIAVAHSMSLRTDNILVTSETISMDFWTTTIPIGFAVLTWLVQVFLVTRLGSSVGDLGVLFGIRNDAKKPICVPESD